MLELFKVPGTRHWSQQDQRELSGRRSTICSCRVCVHLVCTSVRIALSQLNRCQHLPPWVAELAMVQTRRRLRPLPAAVHTQGLTCSRCREQDSHCTHSNTCHLADAFIPSLQWVLVFSAWLGSVEIWTLHPDSASLSHWATNNSQLKVSLKAGCQVWNQASASGCYSWQNPCFISHPSVTCEMMIRCDHTEKFEGNHDVINDLSTFICCFHSSSLSARDTQWASQYKDLVA